MSSFFAFSFQIETMRQDAAKYSDPILFINGTHCTTQYDSTILITMLAVDFFGYSEFSFLIFISLSFVPHAHSLPYCHLLFPPSPLRYSTSTLATPSRPLYYILPIPSLPSPLGSGNQACSSLSSSFSFNPSHCIYSYTNHMNTKPSFSSSPNCSQHSSTAKSWQTSCCVPSMSLHS